MALELDGKVYFIHTNKTGGSWARVVLKNAGLAKGEFKQRHASSREVKAFMPGARTIAFVQDPATWLQSCWAYATSKMPNQDWSWPLWQGGLGNMEFADFIDAYVRIKPGWVSAWMTDHVRGADFIGKFENLELDLVRGLTQLGLPIASFQLQVAPRKVRSRGSWGHRVIYRPGQIEKVYEAEAVLCGRFGYGG